MGGLTARGWTMDWPVNYAPDQVVLAGHAEIVVIEGESYRRREAELSLYRTQSEATTDQTETPLTAVDGRSHFFTFT